MKIGVKFADPDNLRPNLDGQPHPIVVNEEPITKEVCVRELKNLILSCKLCGCDECVRRKNIYLKNIEFLREK